MPFPLLAVLAVLVAMVAILIVVIVVALYLLIGRWLLTCHEEHLPGGTP